MHRVGMVAVGVVALVIGVLAPAAGAGNTELTIKAQGGDFSGKVKSNNGYCIENRTVQLTKKKPGKDKKIVTDTSGDGGEWSAGNTGEHSGKFYAKVKALASCDKAKSKTIKLD